MNTENKLPEDFKKKWVDALKSGEYKQADGFLFSPHENGYCCLGVACRVAGHEPEADEDMEYPNTDLQNLPEMLRGRNALTKLLANMNDGIETHAGEKKSFSEIADWIEQNL